MVAFSLAISQEVKVIAPKSAFFGQIGPVVAFGAIESPEPKVYGRILTARVALEGGSVSFLLSELEAV